MFFFASYAMPIGAIDRWARQDLTPYLVTGATAFVAAVLLALILTAGVRKFAPRFRLLDHPDNRRKLHARPIPVGGGLAVYFATVLVIVALATVPNPWCRHLRNTWWELVVLMVAGGVIVLVGLLDDRFKLRGRVKLIGQCVAAMVVVAGGLNIQAISVFGYSIDLGLAAIPFTLLWLLGAINSVNLLDGIDGMATVLGLIMVATICVMAVLLGRTLEGLVALVFAGSLVGFLRFNFPPASIFLGDTGSMLIGLAVGTLAISASLKGPGTVLLVAPLAVWTIPFLDSLAAILRRRLTGRSIYTTDRGHLHHRLLDLLGNNRRVLAVVAAFCLLTSSGTLLSMFLNNDLIAILACASVVVILVASGIFGRAEFTLVTSRLCKFGQSLFESVDGQTSRMRQSEVRLQGTRHWETLFEFLVASSDQFRLVEICLDVNAPRSHEGYHARWECPVADLQSGSWRLEFPLVVDGQWIGHLLLAGQPKCRTLQQDFQQLMPLLKGFESSLQVVAGEEVPVGVGGGRGAKTLHSLPAEALEIADISRKHPK
jgi:UDP-GlcNAc:undecaprenyl-phosphate GlcNAc-1-phosphate transferase